MTVESYQRPTFQETVKSSADRFLQHFQAGREFGGEEKEEILKEIWRILTFLYPEKRKGETRLAVPSRRLVELGLVSEEAAAEISQRRIRKTNGFEKIKPQDEPLNLVTIKTDSAGFLITKSYLTEEKDFSAVGAGLRRDTVVEEEALLTREGESLAFRMMIREGETHLHAFGRVWESASLSKKEPVYKPVEVTDKDLVRTLVLLSEGIFGPILALK